MKRLGVVLPSHWVVWLRKAVALSKILVFNVFRLGNIVGKNLGRLIEWKVLKIVILPQIANTYK